MTLEETGKILALIYAIFPRAYERQGVEATRNAWQTMFEDEQYDVVKTAVKKVLKTSKFAPTIAEVHIEIDQYKQSLRVTLSQYEYYYGKLPKECQNCTMYDDSSKWLEKFKKCGTRRCVREISDADRKQYFLTSEQVKLIKTILNK